jgi:hypothetical protein
LFLDIIKFHFFSSSQAVLSQLASVGDVWSGFLTSVKSFQDENSKIYQTIDLKLHQVDLKQVETEWDDILSDFENDVSTRLKSVKLKYESAAQKLSAFTKILNERLSDQPYEKLYTTLNVKKSEDESFENLDMIEKCVDTWLQSNK